MKKLTKKNEVMLNQRVNKMSNVSSREKHSIKIVNKTMLEQTKNNNKYLTEIKYSKPNTKI